jgi:hypothetical protein
MSILLARRDFITLLGGAAAWPLAARAQQAEPVRRVGALLLSAKDSPITQSAIAAFREGLAMLGWVEGGNLRMDYQNGVSRHGRNRTCDQRYCGRAARRAAVRWGCPPRLL